MFTPFYFKPMPENMLKRIIQNVVKSNYVSTNDSAIVEITQRYFDELYDDYFLNLNT